MFCAQDEDLKRSHLAEGGSPRLAPSLFDPVAAAALAEGRPLPALGDDSPRDGGSSPVDTGGAAEAGGSGAKGPQGRRTGRAVVTAAQLQAQRQAQVTRKPHARLFGL